MYPRSTTCILVVGLTLLYSAVPSVHGGPCADEGHRLCDPTNNKTFLEITPSEFNSLCGEMLGHRLCYAAQMTHCSAFDDMDLDKHLVQLNYRCARKSAFLKSRECVNQVIQDNAHCDNPELYTSQDRSLDLDRDEINATRQCWKTAMRDKCDAEVAAWYDGYLEVTHELIMDYYDNAVRLDSKCYNEATGACFSPLRKDHSEIWMDDEELDKHCMTEEETTSCLEEKMSDCGSYDQLLIDQEIQRMSYICNDTEEFREHEDCLIGLAFRDDINCTVFELSHFGEDITGEVTEAEVNATKSCWMSAVKKVCPNMADWYEGYENIRYDLVLKYSAAGMPLASLITCLVVLVLGRLLV